MIEIGRRRILFVVNPVSGKATPDWRAIIHNHFDPLPFDISVYQLPEKFSIDDVRSRIDEFRPGSVVAVGGDGTANLLATCVAHTTITLGIIPSGSANGMAKELGIGQDIETALDIVENGFCKKISLVEINDKISLHLADLGLNAFMLQEFERRGVRGLVGYLIATMKVLRRRRKLNVKAHYGNTTRNIEADIILIANATTYGTGVIVNPVGKLDDKVFEIIAIKDLTVRDLLNSGLHTSRLDEAKSEIIQVSSIRLLCTEPAHFQVDGEYVGTVHEVKARLLPDSLNVIVPGADVG